MDRAQDPLHSLGIVQAWSSSQHGLEFNRRLDETARLQSRPSNGQRSTVNPSPPPSTSPSRETSQDAKMILTVAPTLRTWFAPAIDAIFAPGLPFSYRWRLLVLQPLSLITYSIQALPWVFRRSCPFKAEYITVAPGRTLRILVFNKTKSSKTGLRPLHLDIHGGSFLGGLPESNAHFCARLAEETGAAVFATSYRYAPVHPFPAAIDDVDVVLAYLRQHVAAKYGADPDLVTVSGDSAGGNLALATSLSVKPGVVKASVTFYASINLHLSPGEKPPPQLPKGKKDPMRFLYPLFDSYAAKAKKDDGNNQRLSPYFADLKDLPGDMLLVVPGIDLVVREQLGFVERLRGEIERDTEGRYKGRRVEALFVEKGFHGYLGLPSVIVGQELKDQAWDAGVRFIQDAHRKSGWRWP
ncbi:lipase/esterase [Apodospora peruviana]|uniref:Lipase/esterase n=1 Tax=Apodospora peruviana TaxID=516989 RepID=A0AAE0I5N7_9PEZI|nr:lipase/esterase [Apodospora peruviana]